ncbi:Na+/H+ antiporter subunit D [Corticicoccus populi]|uniref:Na+/H+ antiporter subunit D n=1 Tax=Corticicoccus populi TaxID=1812821 RepID=A0ABW5WTL9_9STAP
MIDILLTLGFVIPFFFGVVMLFVGRKKIFAQRIIAALTSVLMVLTGLILVYMVYHNGVLATSIGNWEAPYGINVVIDMISALLILTTSLVTLAVVIYSFQTIGKDRERYYYYPMVMFMISGVIGAFSTGDIFNMFVFFEVFLLASYVLITLGGTKIQVQEGFKYLLINVIASNFFVLAVAYLYSVVGSLNFADIHNKLSGYEGNLAVISIISVVFLLVFAAKAGLFPFYFWLPGSYYAPPMPILTLFGALLTKVGIYAIARTYSLFFIDNIAFTHQMLMMLAAATVIMGSIGAIAYTDMKKVLIYNIIIAVGVIVLGLSMMDQTGSIGALYYLVHDMIIKAALFMLIGFIIYRTGHTRAENTGGLIKVHPWTGWMFLIATLALAGVPPLSGFYGKFYIVQSLILNGHIISAIIVLVSSLAVLYSVIRIFIMVFWGEEMDFTKLKPIKYDKILFASFAMVILAVVFGLCADTLYPLFEMAAQSLYDPSTYSSILVEVD